MVRSAAWLRSAFSLANAFSTGFGAVGRKVEEAERRRLRWRRTAGPCGGERLSIPGESSESDPLNEVAGGNPPTNEAGPSRTKSTGSFDFTLTVQYGLLLSAFRSYPHSQGAGETIHKGPAQLTVLRIEPSKAPCRRGLLA
jgi:hypothetical protein